MDSFVDRTGFFATKLRTNSIKREFVATKSTFR